jgi:hypothetical protein
MLAQQVSLRSRCGITESGVIAACGTQAGIG